MSPFIAANEVCVDFVEGVGNLVFHPIQSTKGIVDGIRTSDPSKNIITAPLHGVITQTGPLLRGELSAEELVNYQVNLFGVATTAYGGTKTVSSITSKVAKIPKSATIKGVGNTQSFWCKVKTSVTKEIDINKISYNPNDDVFKRGFNEQSVSYQRTYYAQNGRFNCSQEPIVIYDIGNGKYMMQNGHHRLKAAKDLNLQTIKVDQIIPYSESVKLGVTDLPTGQIPR